MLEEHNHILEQGAGVALYQYTFIYSLEIGKCLTYLPMHTLR